MTTLNFAMVGYAFMGKAHSHALHEVVQFFPDLPARPVRKVLCGRTGAEVERVATQWGWESWTTDWRDAIGRSDVDAVIVGTPNHTHHEICLAALAARKHVLCEKPLALTLSQAEEMAAAAQRAGSATGSPSTIAGSRPSRWPARSSPKAGWDKSTTSGRLSCRIGCWTLRCR